MALNAASRLAVGGASAAGKSTLLHLLACALVPEKGQLWWDDVSLTDVSKRTRKKRIALFPQEPSWPKQPLWHLLGLPDAALIPATRKVLKSCGALDVLRRLPEGLETVIASDRLAVGERRALLLGRTLLTKASLILLDDPFKGLGRKSARRRLRAVLARHGQATVIVAAERLPSHKLFDRVVKLKNGRVVFVGTPEELRAAKRQVTSDPVPAVHSANGSSLNGDRA